MFRIILLTDLETSFKDVSYCLEWKQKKLVHGAIPSQERKDVNADKDAPLFISQCIRLVNRYKICSILYSKMISLRSKRNSTPARIDRVARCQRQPIQRWRKSVFHSSPFWPINPNLGHRNRWRSILVRKRLPAHSFRSLVMTNRHLSATSPKSICCCYYDQQLSLKKYRIFKHRSGNKLQFINFCEANNFATWCLRM